jgi:hypothetical protein
MSVTSKPLYPAAYLGATDTTLYTAGPGVRTILDKVTAYNSDTGALLVSLNLVPNGGSLGAANKVVSKTIAAGDTYTFPEVVGHVLESGGVLSGIAASASKVVIRVSGREVV